MDELSLVAEFGGAEVDGARVGRLRLPSFGEAGVVSRSGLEATGFGAASVVLLERHQRTQEEDVFFGGEAISCAVSGSRSSEDDSGSSSSIARALTGFESAAWRHCTRQSMRGEPSRRVM